MYNYQHYYEKSHILNKLFAIYESNLKMILMMNLHFRENIEKVVCSISELTHQCNMKKVNLTK